MVCSYLIGRVRTCPKRHPFEFRRGVLDLVAAGRSLAEVAEDLGVYAQTPQRGSRWWVFLAACWARTR